MMKTLLCTAAVLMSGLSFGQTQIGNAGFENWESVGSGEEPVNWNSFLSAQGSLTGFAGDQCESSTDVRPGSAGVTSARIWSRDAGFGVVANGNMTLGRINMGSLDPSDADNNFNLSLTADSDFSEALTDAPDSIVFWIKYTPNSGSENARMKATLHDDYDCHDPEGTGGSAAHVVATAELNFDTQGGTWRRIAVPFNYGGPASVHTYILVTFSSNSNPGGGNVGDELLVDDVELIYNNNKIDENVQIPVEIGVGESQINLFSNQTLDGTYGLYSLDGTICHEGNLSQSIPFDVNTGLYILKLSVGTSLYSFKVYKK